MMKGLERERNLEKKIYFADDYFSYQRLWSFVDQIYHIRSLNPQKMVEIGIGNGFVSGFFKSMGIIVKTFDINADLEPDIIAPVSEIDCYLKPYEYDLISCCEVLEHLPFDEFEKIIKKFSTLSNKLFITLPVHGRNFGFGGVVHLPKFYRWFGIWLKFPILRSLSFHLPDMHFWEIDYDAKTRRKRIQEILNRYYLGVETGIFIANPYHRYFKCRGVRGQM